MFNNIFQELTNKKYSVLLGLIVFVILALQGISNFRFDASSETLFWIMMNHSMCMRKLMKNLEPVTL